MRYISRKLTLSAVLLMTLTGIALAQGPRPMTLVDLLNVPRISDPQLAPDGRHVLYVRSEADWKTNKRIGHVWRAEVEGTRAVQMTNAPDGESSPRWSPDGKTIAFVSKRGDADASQLYLLAIDGGEAQQLTRHATSVSDPTWTPDGSAIYFLAPDEKTEEERDREKAKDDVYAFDANYKQRHLWKVSVGSRVRSEGASAPATTEQKITDGDYTISSYQLSRDGRRIAAHRAPSPLVTDGDRSEVWVMEATGGNAVQITRNSLSERNGRLSPDNSQVLFTAGANQQFETYYNGAVFIAPAAGGTARLLLPDFQYEVSEAAWSSDGRAIYMLVNMGVHSQLFEVDVSTRRAQQLTRGDHALQAWTVVPAASRHVFQIDEAAKPGEVWVLPASAASSPKQVTHVFDALAAQFKLPRQQKVEWKGADGVAVEGLLYYPIDYEAGKRYPLVVQTHGGPRGSDKFGFGSWSSYVPVLAAKGYAVLKPNYRGSTGYGNAFLRDMVGHYFQNAHLDVIAGVDHVIKMGVADPDRLVKMGWSAGGHMTNKIVTFTNRFKAASSGAGAANWVSMYAQSDTRAQRTPWFGGTPWQANAPIDVYWEQSPLKYVSRVTTPTLLLVGERDERVPSPQSVEFYRALKSNGVPTRLYLAPREPHGWSELRHQLFKMNVELDWFEKYALQRPYTWERAPGDAPARKTTSN
jgi:dipeptidyl aminopeptidase/acylaminoacyl peptidase